MGHCRVGPVGGRPPKILVGCSHDAVSSTTNCPIRLILLRIKLLTLTAKAACRRFSDARFLLMKLTLLATLIITINTPSSLICFNPLTYCRLVV